MDDQNFPKHDAASEGAGQIHTSAACTGFASPADDYLDGALDLNKLLVKNPPATFYMRVKGDSMTGAGIHTDDILIVDRSVAPKHNSVIVAVLNGELTVKRLWKKNNQLFLMPDNPQYRPIDVTYMEDFQVWGVAVSVIHSLKVKS